MDTPAIPFRTRTLPRWLRVVLFLAPILLVQGTLAYLLTWIDPPRHAVFVPIRINSYLAPQPRHADKVMALFPGTIPAGTKRADIQQTLDGLAAR